MIPRGSRGGTAFQFIVVVHTCERSNVLERDLRRIFSPGSSENFLDDKPLFGPFDRTIKFEKIWYYIPNIYFHDDMVFFKEDLNSTEQWIIVYEIH